MTPPDAGTDRKRPRRSSVEVRRLILEAAADVFAEKSYAGATTREIAERADVAEPTMFRIYGNKDALFEAAVLAPFERFMVEFTERWLAAEIPGGEPGAVLTQFVTELHALVVANRTLFSAIATSEHPMVGAQAAVSRLERVGEAISSTYGIEFDVPVAVRIATVAVVATTMLETSFFPPELRGDRLLNELIRMLVGSTLYAPTNDF